MAGAVEGVGASIEVVFFFESVEGEDELVGEGKVNTAPRAMKAMQVPRTPMAT